MKQIQWFREGKVVVLHVNPEECQVFHEGVELTFTLGVDELARIIQKARFS